MGNQEILNNLNNGIDVLGGLIQTQGLIVNYILCIFIIGAVFKIFANLKNHKYICSYLIDIINFIFAIILISNSGKITFLLIFAYLVSNIAVITSYILIKNKLNENDEYFNEDEDSNYNLTIQILVDSDNDYDDEDKDEY